jgi:hypothetical protein
MAVDAISVGAEVYQSSNVKYYRLYMAVRVTR